MPTILLLYSNLHFQKPELCRLGCLTFTIIFHHWQNVLAFLTYAVFFQGRQWGEMAPEVKQHYQQIAEEGRQKYDQVKQEITLLPPPPREKSFIVCFSILS